MTKQDLKHALISLAIGIVITALTSLVDGVIVILKGYVHGVVGGGIGTIAYLKIKHFI